MHYYTNNVNARSDEKDFAYTLRGHKLKFTTDIGVFSKRDVDFGSRLLVESFTVPEVDGNILDVGCGYGPIGLSLAKSYVNSLEQLKSLFPNMQDDLSLSLVARYPDVITIEEKSEDLEAIWEEINSLLNMAVENMISMRKVEGEKLASDILVKCSSIEEIVAFIEKKSEVIVASYKQKLEDRLKNLLGEVPVDENRVAMEVAVFADKASIDEEIIRLRSHINQLRKTLTLDEPIGRKLDFIVQEMNREANTIASKSTDLEITNKVIDIKNIIEKIREQVQNIE